MAGYPSDQYYINPIIRVQMNRTDEDEAIPLTGGTKVERKEAVTFGKKFLVIYLYFVQGVFLNIPSTIVMTYKEIPNYSILGYFSIILLPFSCKFISAPVIEKYSSVKYGRRKTWVVISLIGAGLLLLLISPLAAIEQEETQIRMAILFTGVIFLVSLEDISVDALSVKELQSTELPSFYQCIMQPIGGVFGSMVMLEMVNGSITSQLGFKQPLLTVTQFLNIVAGLTLCSALMIHFLYTETVTKAEQDGVPHSLWEVIKHYKHFLQPKYRMCRQGITTLVTFHGLVYFSSSYTVELIKNHNFSKQLLTSLSNFCLIPIFVLTHLLSKYWTDPEKLHSRTRIVLACRLLLMFLAFIFNLTDTTGVCIFIIVLSLLSNAQFFTNSLITNSFSTSKFAGMYITMMASLTNFGNNSTLQLRVIDNYGYSAASIFGFIYTVVVVMGYGKIETWIKNGQEDCDMQTKQK